MLRSLRNLFQLLRIARILARHNALFVIDLALVLPGVSWVAGALSHRNVPGRPGQRLARALREMGPSFIKLGQMLSTRPDLVGEAIAADLAELQDSLPPFPAAIARQIIEDELGQPIAVLFATFDETPVAAASIAQVHFALTPEGRAVAVKVLRPDIERGFSRDISLFHWLAELALRAQPGLSRLRPTEVVAVFERTCRLEMDLRLEAAAASELAENFRNDPSFTIPEIDWNRTSRRVLTLERIHGIPVDEVERIRAAGFDPDRALAQASSAFFNQVFRDGFFHADLHPGNMFVNEHGNIAVVDFGIMGRLDRATRTYLADMLLGFLNGDYRRVAKVHFDAGFVPPHHSLEIFTQACRAIGEPVRNKPLNEISVGRLLAQLFAVTEQFDMQTQPHLLLLQKSMLTAEGVGRILNPSVNMWELARPLIESWMREHRGPEARVLDEVEGLVRAVRRVPDVLRETERLTAQLNEGGLRLHPDSLRRLEGSRRHHSPLAALSLVVAVLALAVALTAVLSGT